MAKKTWHGGLTVRSARRVAEHPRALALLRNLEERRPRASTMVPAVPAAMKKTITLQFRDANLRMIFDAISREAGINFVLDRDIPAAARATILVKNTPIEDAVESLIVTNALAKKVVSESHVLIYPNTPQKAREYQDLVIRNFYLQSAEAKQMLTLLRTILKSQNIFIDEKRNLLVMRDTPEAIRLAEKLIAAHDQVEPEVMLEVEILEISRIKDSDIGVQFPNQVFVRTPIRSRCSVENLNSSGINVGGWIPPWRFNLKSSSKPQTCSPIRVSACATVKKRRSTSATGAGHFKPISAASVLPALRSARRRLLSGSRQSNSKSKRSVLDDEVMIKVNLEVSSLGALEKVDQAIAYRVGTRNAATTTHAQGRETRSSPPDQGRGARDGQGSPGLGDVPFIGRLFSNKRAIARRPKSYSRYAADPPPARAAQAPIAEYWSGRETICAAGYHGGSGVRAFSQPKPGLKPGGVFPACHSHRHVPAAPAGVSSAPAGVAPAPARQRRQRPRPRRRRQPRQHHPRPDRHCRRVLSFSRLPASAGSAAFTGPRADWLHLRLRC